MASACQVAFEFLTKCLTKTTVLGHPNFNLHFVVHTVASEIGFEVLLIQKSDLVSLNPTERNYSATELECLAVVWAVEKWRVYLECHLFTVVTDHASLLWVF